jgi:hypothetical protein
MTLATLHDVVWQGVDAFRVEHAVVHLHADRLLARGTQIGVTPLPYEARYSLDTRERFETARLTVDAAGAGWSRRLDLLCDASGTWHASTDTSGDVDLPDPDGDARSLAEAVDCDLAFSPLTNTMPLLRDGLVDGGEARDYAMAWVSLPDLAVHRSEQRYEPLGEGAVRFVSRDDDFTAKLEFDGYGLVVRYEGLAERVTP